MSGRWYLSERGPDPSATPILAEPLEERHGVIQAINHIESPPGAPQSFTQITADIANTTPLSSAGVQHEVGAGTDVSADSARIKAIGEAVERYCLSIYDTADLSKGRAEAADNRVPAETFNKSGEPLTAADYYWTPATEHKSGEEVAIPAQLVYFPFTAEQFIRNPITTGAATHVSYRAATRAAVQEIVERDAYIISYLNELESPHIGAELIEKANATEIISEFRAHGFEPTLVYITLDIPVHVVLCILVDEHHGNVECGLTADFDLTSSIRQSLLESYHTYCWLREMAAPEDPSSIEIHSIEDRARFWLAKQDTEGLNHWLGDGHPVLEETPAVIESIPSLLQWFTEREMAVYVSDVSTSDTQQHYFNTVRAVIPDLHPMHLAESWKYVGGQRLYDAPVRAGLRETERTEDELNDVPHPFL